MGYFQKLSETDQATTDEFWLVRLFIIIIIFFFCRDFLLLKKKKKQSNQLPVLLGSVIWSPVDVAELCSSCSSILVPASGSFGTVMVRKLTTLFISSNLSLQNGWIIGNGKHSASNFTAELPDQFVLISIWGRFVMVRIWWTGVFSCFGVSSHPALTPGRSATLTA